MRPGSLGVPFPWTGKPGEPMTDEKISALTLVDEVADRMREMLYSGEFRAGEKLRMRDLMARFGVSHIPIREALRMLEVEGLVINLPQRGAVAAPVSLGVLAEVYDARRLLEPALAKRSAPLLIGEHLDRLTAAYEELRHASSSDKEFFRAHATFHWLTMAPGATPTLERFIRQLWGISERFVRLSLAFPNDVAPAIDQHHEIYRLASQRDERVGEVIRVHLHLTEDAMRAHFSEMTMAGDPPA